MSKPMTDFTVVVPHWAPRVTPVELSEATEEQLAAMETTPSNRGIGAYTLVLAHDPQTLTYRTPLFNGIMYSKGGLSRDETELAATAASVLNKCIYCAAVHASRFNQITKTENVMFKKDILSKSGKPIERNLDFDFFSDGCQFDPRRGR